MKTLIAAITALFIATPAFAVDNATLNNLVDQTNFLVNSGCSGTLINKAEGYILTAAHCIVDQYETVTKEEIDKDGNIKEVKVKIARPGTVSQKFFNGPNEIQQNQYVYKIKASSLTYDLALLQVQTKLPQTTEAKLACTAPKRLDTVYAVGNSFAVLYSTVNKGTVSSLERNYRDLNIAGDLGDLTDSGEHGLMQHSAATAPGNSGGAILNENGSLVGVHVRGTRQIGGFGFAVPLEDIQTFFKNNNINVTCNG